MEGKTCKASYSDDLLDCPSFSPFIEPCTSSETILSSAFPKSTSDWDIDFVDKLGMKYHNENIHTIITIKWCLFDLTENEYNQIDKIVDACSFGALNISSLEEISPVVVNPFKKWYSLWCPRSNDVKVLKSEPLLERFEMRLEEFAFTLAHLIAKKRDGSEITEWKYQMLFEKVLHLFDIKTLSKPFIDVEKTMIMGKTVSSEADILCCRTDPSIHRSIISICEAKKMCVEENTGTAFPQRKKLRKSSSQLSDMKLTIEKGFLSQHIGELFVHLHKSVTTRGILGMTVEKTAVRITFLQVEPKTLQKIKLSRDTGSMEFEDWERPHFFFSDRLDFLHVKDRRILFKALLLIKMMLVKYERGAEDDSIW